HELRQAERRLRAEGARALVLDLRFCSTEGGVHPAEVTAGGLVDRRLLWRVRDARGRARECRSGGESLFRGWPVAVLVSGDTGGTPAQALLAALQDSGRAILVGERTRGDGYLTSILPLPEGGLSLALRTGRLERAARGRGWPVEPDHAVPLDKSRREAV